MDDESSGRSFQANEPAPEDVLAALGPVIRAAEAMTGSVTLVFTDIEGSTRLLQTLGFDSYSRLLAEHHRLMRTAIETYGGQEVKTEGDSFFAVFREPADAVRAAVQAQQAIAEQEWPDNARPSVRMGLHTGEVALAGDEYVGIDVNRAARISAAAHGGQVLISDDTRSHIEQALPSGVRVRDLGLHRLKDIPEPERLHQLVIDGLAADFPPPRSLEIMATNLPEQLTTFLGRERELAEMRALVERSRLVTLTGPGGTGKTRLCLQLANDMLGSFPDGVHFVALAALREPDLVLPAIAHSFKVAEGENLRGRLVEAIGSKQLLLILDNFEQLMPAAGEVSELLARTPRLKILVTSQSRLQLQGEREYLVPPLGVPDPRRLPPMAQLSRTPAIALFVDRARAVRPDFELTPENMRAVAEICARLDGLPLAIELAAARVRLLSPEQVAARLSDRLGLLATSSVDVSERQRTLRGAIQWSYDLLAEEERPLFRRLGVFLSGAPLTMIARVLDSNDEFPLLEQLGSLIDKSLIRRSPESPGDDGRLRIDMLESIREFAVERLAEADEAAAYRERHAAAYVEFAEDAHPKLTGEEARRWLDRVELEHDNLRATFVWAIEAQRADVAVRLCAALWRFWQMRGHLTEGRERAEQAVDLSKPLADHAVRETAHSTAGSLAYWQADWPAARAHYEAALEFARAAGVPGRIADALYNLSFAFFAPPRGDIEQAHELLAEALVIYREIGDREGVAKTLWALGAVANSYDEPRTDAALEYYREASTTFEAMGNRPMLAWSRFMRAGAEAAAGMATEARLSTQAALRVFVELGDLSGYAMCLHFLAVLEWFDCRRESAARLAGAAERLARTTGVKLADLASSRWLERLGAESDALERSQVERDQTLAEAWAEGEALDVDQAVALALGVGGP